LAQLCSLRARVHEQLDNRAAAATWAGRALEVDVWCTEAMEMLLDRHLLTVEEERDLISSLDFSGCDDGDGSPCWLRDLYISRLSGAGGALDFGDRGPTEDRPGARRAGPAHSFFQDQSVATSFASIIDAHEPPENRSVMIRDRFSLAQTPIQSHDATLPHAHAPSRVHTPDDAPDVDAAFHRLRTVHGLGHTSEVLVSSALRAYARHGISEAHALCAAAHRLDPLCDRALFVRVACLADLARKGDLFHESHRLVDARPRSAASWFAVGCYYRLCGRVEAAQRHFGRATRLNPRCAEAWIAFGNAFAAADESDQAMSAYRAAQRLHAGGHLPLLYIGMEYLRTNNLELAKHFLNASSGLAPGDPLAFNELGVHAHRQEEHTEAIGLFVHALRLCAALRPTAREFGAGDGVDHTPSDAAASLLQMSEEDVVLACRDPFWEPTIFNLGQSYRKIRRFENAALCFEKAMALVPGNPSSYAALGYTRHLLGDVDAAIESYHQALGMDPDDAFSGEMLHRALQESFAGPASDAFSARVAEAHADDVGGFKAPHRAGFAAVH